MIFKVHTEENEEGPVLSLSGRGRKVGHYGMNRLPLSVFVV